MTKEEDFEIIEDQVRIISMTLAEIAGYLDNIEEAANDLKDRPPAERRGKWVLDGLNHRGGVDWMHCSACGYRIVNVPTDLTPFCPYCGARMEE